MEVNKKVKSQNTRTSTPLFSPLLVQIIEVLHNLPCDFVSANGEHNFPSEFLCWFGILDFPSKYLCWFGELDFPSKYLCRFREQMSEQQSSDLECQFCCVFQVTICHCRFDMEIISCDGE